MDAAFMLLERGRFACWRRRPAYWAQEAPQSLWHHPCRGSTTPAEVRLEYYCMDAAAMSLELHERGSHVVRAGELGGGAGVRGSAAGGGGV